MAKKSKNNLIKSIIIILLGILTILPLFLNFFGLKVSNNGITNKWSIPLFLDYTSKTSSSLGATTINGSVSDLFKSTIITDSLLHYKTLFTITIVITIIGAIVGVAMAVIAVLELFKIKIPSIENIKKYLAYTLIAIAILILIFGLLFVIFNLSDLKNLFGKDAKFSFFGVEGYLISILASAGCGFATLKL